MVPIDNFFVKYPHINKSILVYLQQNLTQTHQQQPSGVH